MLPKMEYPRPQLQRSHWICLNGPWKFTFDESGRFGRPSDISDWPHIIEVPFAPESAKRAKPRGKQDWHLEAHSIWQYLVSAHQRHLADGLG